jgi:sugar O-acyltransferase (sialic acid O-acetyltransferase NeuD family)
MTDGLIVLGAGGHAKVVIDAARCAGWHLAGLLDDDPAKRGHAFFGVAVLGDCAAWRTTHSAAAFVIAIGSNGARARLQEELQASGRRVVTVRHPFSALADSARVEDGTVFMAGTVVNADAVIGRGVIVNTGATVDHDCRIADWVHIAPGSVLCGGVRVGAGTLIGVGARVLPGVRIGHSCVVGGGAVVHRDLPDCARVAGVPARSIGTAR